MTPLFIALAAVAVIAIIEIVFSSRWNRTYFTTGIPIFVNRVECATLESVPLEDLQKRTATAAGPALAFHRYDADVIGFRESGLVQYAPLMRGCIRRDRVVGYINWYFLALLVVIAAVLRRDVVNIWPAFVGIPAVLYLIQGVRFWRVARALRAVPASA